MTRPKCEAGSTSCAAGRAGSARSALPMTGKERQCSANASSRKMPETKTGNDNPSRRQQPCEKIDRRGCGTARHKRRRARRSACPISIAATVRSIVCGSTAPTSARIGRSVTIERPKSPDSERAEEVDVLLPERLVEPKLRIAVPRRLRRRAVAEDRDRGIARNDPHDDEHQRQHRQQRRYRC